MNKAADKSMSYDELRGAIAQRHRALSGRLQQIAEFVLDHPTEVALGTVAEVAARGRRGAELQGAARAHEARGEIDPRPQARGSARALRRGGAVGAGDAER